MVMWSVKKMLMMWSAELVRPVGLAAPVPCTHATTFSSLFFSWASFFQKDIFVCHCFKVNCCQKTAFSAYVSYSNGQHTFLCFNINRLWIIICQSNRTRQWSDKSAAWAQVAEVLTSISIWVIHEEWGWSFDNDGDDSCGIGKGEDDNGNSCSK